MNIKVSYFQIAGFIIKFVFYPSIFKSNINENSQILIEEDLFKEFLIEKINKKNIKEDYTIQFFSRKKFDVLSKQKKQYLLISISYGRKIKTFYDISIAQLIHLVLEVVNELLASNGFIIHASAVGKNNSAYLFLGQSGAGKSTIVNLLKKSFTPLADDTVIIKKEQNKFFLYQTPLKEKPEWIEKSKKRYFIKKIYFLKKSDKVKVERIKDREKNLAKIMKQFWIQRSNKDQIKLILDFIANNDFYLLYFSKSETLVNNFFEKCKRKKPFH